MKNGEKGNADPYESEQNKVDGIYGLFDKKKGAAGKNLASVRMQKDLNLTSMSERDSFATMYEDKIAALRESECGLVFGKLKMESGENRYIGRLGLFDKNQNPVLLDWRAPASSPFYEATYFDSLGVSLRRHITVRERKVRKLEDELLKLTSKETEEALKRGLLSGEGALMASLEKERTGKMEDIVSTIQREQNRIIRMPLNSVAVVQGAPGTGKTAVALHRAAYLLYAYRERLERDGVLMICPSKSFANYIDGILPSLGETNVSIKTIEEMVPGVRVNWKDSPIASKIKGDLRMAHVIRSAIKSRIRVPKELPEILINGTKLKIEKKEVLQAQAWGKTFGSYGQGRREFISAMLSCLFRKYESQLKSPIPGDEKDLVMDQIRENPQVRLALNLSWFPLSAKWLLDDLFSKPEKLKRLAPWMSDWEVKSLMREKGKVSKSDIPLIDMALGILGEKTGQGAVPGRADEEFAKETMEMYGVPRELVNMSDFLFDVGASRDSNLEGRRRFGHVIVDEAQELTPMEWRMLKKKCASNSFTIVGDIAQTCTLAGAKSWKKRLSPVFGKDWTLCELDIDYRNPKEVIEAASDFIRGEGVRIGKIKAVRSVKNSLQKIECKDVARAAAQKLAECAREFVHGAKGTVVLVCKRDVAEDMENLSKKALEAEFGDLEAGRMMRDGGQGAQVSVKGIGEIKGIEYDAVVLADPDGWMEEGESKRIAASKLYVAMTRPTQKLVVVKRGLPPSGGFGEPARLKRVGTGSGAKKENTELLQGHTEEVG